MSDTVRIFVACHKPDTCWCDDVYTPIHVGRTISKFREEMSAIIGDDTGDNISAKNPYYCELTAQYWMWKNVHDVEYIGLAHYRRYFATKLSSANIKSIMKHACILLAEPICEKFSVAHNLAYSLTREDVYIFMSCIRQYSPEYYKAACKVLSQNKYTPYNMFVMRKADFDKYASWQFGLLAEVEKQIRFSPYTRLKRILGYFAEVMFVIYCEKNRINIKYESVVGFDGKKILKNKYNIFRRIYVNIAFRCFNYRRLTFDDPAVKVGLKNDGVELYMV